MGGWINTVIQGIMIGGLYAMFAIGLAMIFGVMKLVNIAHGDLIVLSAYVALIVTQTLGINPLLSLLFVVPIMAVIGYLLQRGLFNRTLGGDLMPPLLVSFGLSVIIQNGLLQFFSADNRRLQAGSIEVASLRLSEAVNIGVLPLLQLALAVLVIAGLQYLLYRTAIGRSFRAVSDDPKIAQLMGLNNQHVFGLAMGLSLAIVALAGVLLAIRANFDPATGPTRLIFSFWGTLAGGIILGVVQALAASIDPGFQILAGHLAFLVVLAVRPAGLFGSKA
jgi:branched-chain amino acid transport system permease protein